MIIVEVACDVKFLGVGDPNCDTLYATTTTTKFLVAYSTFAVRLFGHTAHRLFAITKLCRL